MKIAVVSDTHSDVEAFEKCLGILQREGIDVLFHCGDWTSASMVDAISKFDIKVYGVFGNCDYGREAFLEKASKEIIFGSDFIDIKFDDVRIGVTHGHIYSLYNEMIVSEKFDLFLFGHTHKFDVEKIGRTMCVNPGSISKSRMGKNSFAIIDLTNLNVKKVEL